MINKFKEIDIKNRTCYFLDDKINIKYLDLNKIKMDANSYRKILIYCIAYMTVSYIRVNSVKPLYLIHYKISRYIEESKGKKFMQVPTNKSKDILNRSEELQNKIGDLIRSITNDWIVLDNQAIMIKSI